MLALRAHGIALLLLLAYALPVAAAEPIPEGVWCGVDHWFTLEGPEGWRTESALMDDKRILHLLPSGETPDEAIVQIDISLMLSPDPGSEGSMTIDERLDAWLSEIEGMGRPSTVERLAAPNPRHPAAGRALVFDRGTLYVVGIDAASGRGHVFSVSLSKRGGDATPDELELLRRTVASLEFDPGRGCRSDATGMRSPITLTGASATAALSPSGPTGDSSDRSTRSVK